jgi:hypothetical protein
MGFVTSLNTPRLPVQHRSGGKAFGLIFSLSSLDRHSSGSSGLDLVLVGLISGAQVTGGDDALGAPIEPEGE